MKPFSRFSTAVGYQAGYSNATGTRSVLIGATAGYAATALDGDTHIGYAAGNSQTTGFANTLVGSRGSASSNGGAGNVLTTGTYNTFIGGNAGSVVTTGSKNTVLGNYSGNQGGLDIRTASNRVVLSDGDGNPRLYADNNGAWQSTSAVGDAVLYPAQFCRVWVNFNGVPTLSVRGSANVSSVTRSANGIYVVNFTTAMPDANYSVVGMNSGAGVNNGEYSTGILSMATSSVTLEAFKAGVGTTDPTYFCVAVFR